jgi:hypothetical protein
MSKVRRTGLPPDQASVMDLKPNEVSPLLSSPTGYFVYKITDKDTIPLAKAHDEILATLRSQRLQESRQALQNRPRRPSTTNTSQLPMLLRE